MNPSKSGPAASPAKAAATERLHKPHATVRQIASRLKLSRTTVSDALRGTGRVNPETAERVRGMADELGYRRNPLATALMAEMRRQRGDAFHGVIAAIDFREQQAGGNYKPFHTELMRGATERAASLGFLMERFVIGHDGLTVSRLNEILLSRNIHGVMVLPAWNAPDLSALSWERYAGLYTDYIIKYPALHSICSDHYRTMFTALSLLTERGYERPGLCIEKSRDDRLQRRHSASFHSHYQTVGQSNPVPPLILDGIDKASFMRWFKKHKPDAIIYHFTEVIDWMEECGAKVPETHGYLSLNTIWRQRPCAGFDLQPAVIGARAVEAVIAQLLRNELGIPEFPTMATIPSRWVEGPTLRPPSKIPVEEPLCGSPRLIRA